MTEFIIKLDSPEQTQSLGRLLGEKLPSGSVIALLGNLGAGKTCLTQGIAAGLGVPESMPVISPSYTLACEYHGRLPLYHLDLYRLEEDDFFESGLDEYFLRGGLVVIEWADKLREDLPEPRIEIELAVLKDGGRTANLRTVGCELGTPLSEIVEKFA